MLRKLYDKTWGLPVLPNELVGRSARLTGLNSLNIIMGRNGAGKSRFLRDLEEGASQNKDIFNVRYVSPERAGSFKRDGGTITNMSSNPEFLRLSRAVNQASNFKAASSILFGEAEKIYLRRLERTPKIRSDPNRNFENDRLNKIKQLLTNISMEADGADFVFRSLVDGQVIRPEDISSGESEVVALGSEILYFFDTIKSDKINVLLLDEPDVHLHPDLQARLGKLIISMLEEFNEDLCRIVVCISTHSSSLVCSLADSKYTSIGTKCFGVDAIELKPANVELRKVAPFFGHPLSLSLSDDVALIVEGEDDERVWQQAARTLQGRIKVFPVLAGSVNQQHDLEIFCVKLLQTLYDNPIAFSVRDGDGIVEKPLTHLLPLKRYRIQCYAIENILLSDSCLAIMKTTWEEFTAVAKRWIGENPMHHGRTLMNDLVNSKDRCRHKKIKEVRNLICHINGCKKPWEIVVGQAIGSLQLGDIDNSNMMVEFLGADMVKDIIFRNIPDRINE
jgi:ABC-type ATPase involved in cell division